MEQELNSLHGRCSGLQEVLNRARQFGFTDDVGTPNLLAENKALKDQVSGRQSETGDVDKIISC